MKKVIAPLTILVLSVSIRVAASAETVLYNFSSESSGMNPAARVIFDAAGNLYGTTPYGGQTSCGQYYNCGVVFELQPDGQGGWTESVLYSFKGGNDGGNPYAGLVFDTAGNLYGTTIIGGDTSCGKGAGCGTVFELSPGSGGSWTETVLYRFTGGNDGSTPYSDLVIRQGNLYGTTEFGGAHGTGVVFELSPNGNSWTETVLHSFRAYGSGDAANPVGGVTFDAAGLLYGTSLLGGTLGGFGAVYQLKPSGQGWTESVLHSFAFADGAYPEYVRLIQDDSGNLYGSTAYGGKSGACFPVGCGVLFELKKPSGHQGWREVVLHDFGTGSNDGLYPYAGLVFDTLGDLYGTTYLGGPKFYGSVFQFRPTKMGWVESILYGFHGGTDGYQPTASLTLDSHHNLYGTATVGGYCCYGVVFEVTH
jgi:uncharacterized repeat protein (TIGR03803 family)